MCSLCLIVSDIQIDRIVTRAVLWDKPKVNLLYCRINRGNTRVCDIAVMYSVAETSMITQKKMLSLCTKINWFQPCLKSDWSRLDNRPLGDIRYLKVTGSRPAWGKSLAKMFWGLKTHDQRLLRTGGGQIYGLELVPLHHLGLCKYTL